MTTDCPSGAQPERRRLAVIAGTLAAGTALAAAPAAWAEPPSPFASPAESRSATPDSAPDSTTVEPTDLTDEVPPGPAPEQTPLTFDQSFVMGIPVNTTHYEMGVIVVEHRERPTVEWSLWGRLDAGIAGQYPNVRARRLTPPRCGARRDLGGGGRGGAHPRRRARWRPSRRRVGRAPHVLGPSRAASS